MNVIFLGEGVLKELNGKFDRIGIIFVKKLLDTCRPCCVVYHSQISKVDQLEDYLFPSVTLHRTKYGRMTSLEAIEDWIETYSEPCNWVHLDTMCFGYPQSIRINKYIGITEMDILKAVRVLKGR